ncbi:MAG: hypothetical protein V7786_02000 [Sulfitobacter litoralis]|uniref:hypothetical protein n=1 Tax=Sulfitobacter litoralis TaxID=335975 RepID=UPI003001AB06
MAGHDGYTRYTTRIPDALYERIKAAAGEKSVNAEIVATLEEKYPEEVLSAEAFLDYLQRLTGPMSMDESVQKEEFLNHVLKRLGVGLEAQLSGGDIILCPTKYEGE